MSDVKFSQDLFLGVEELNRFKKTLKQDGFEFILRAITESYGVVYNQYLDSQFKWLRVESSNTANSIKVLEGYAFNDNGQVIYQNGVASSINVFDADVWQWVIIKQANTNVEGGLVSIGGKNKSLMTGKDTKFTEILRGQPNFPSTIRFNNSARYNLEYEVLEVIDDTNVLIQGVFDVVEENLEMIVVGTFTPGAIPSDAEKNVFLYNNSEIKLIQETTDNTPPSIVKGQEFILARIQNSSTNGLIIQDKRTMNVFKLRPEFQNQQISADNSLIGVQAVKKFSNRGKVNFLVELDWKLNIFSETRNYQNNLVSISNGKGGAYQSTADFTDNAFDGWRYYYEDGTSSKVLRSVKNSGNIDIYLDELKENLIGTFVAPDCNEVEITALIKSADDTVLLYKKPYLFNVNTSSPSLVIGAEEIFAPSGGQLVEFKFKHKKGNITSTEAGFNTGNYFTEEAFNANGILTDNTKYLINKSPKIGITL